MTDEQWEMVKRTPEWAAARERHRLTMERKWKTLQAKFSREREALEARQAKQTAKLKAAHDAALQEHRELSDKLENEGISAVFEKYGLKPGRD